MSKFTYNYVALTLYLVTLCVYVKGFKGFKDVGDYLKENRKTLSDDIRKMNGLGGYFFTNWNFILQIIFLVTAILHEVSIIRSLPVDTQKRFGQFRAFIFNALTFPSSCIVASVFWTLWHIERELIFPKILDEYFPSWLNHVLHTFIMVPMIIELLLPKEHNFVSFSKAAKALFIYVTIYQILYLSIYFRYGIWLYPIYETFTWTERIIFSLFQLLLGLSYAKLGTTIQNSKKSVKSKGYSVLPQSSTMK